MGTDEEELDIDIYNWTVAPKNDEDGTEKGGASRVEDVVECRSMLVADVHKAVLRFVEKFNANF